MSGEAEIGIDQSDGQKIRQIEDRIINAVAGGMARFVMLVVLLFCWPWMPPGAARVGWKRFFSRL